MIEIIQVWRCTLCGYSRIAIDPTATTVDKTTGICPACNNGRGHAYTYKPLGKDFEKVYNDNKEKLYSE